MAKFLIDNDADIKISNNYGKSPLYMAVEKGNAELVNMMLKRGVPIDFQARDSAGTKYYTPLTGAVLANNYEMVTLLLSHGANPSILSADNSDSACSFAKERRNRKIINLLGSKCDMDKVLSKTDRICQQLEKKVKTKGAGNSSLNTLHKLIPKDSKSWKPLKDVMIKYQSSDLMDASARCDVNLVKWMVEHDENPNQVFSNGKTPLLSAVRGKNMPVIEYLVKAGAAINYKNKFGHTPLTLAIKDGFDEVALLLLDKGANPNIPGKGEASALAMTAGMPNRKESKNYDEFNSVKLLKKLLEKGANPNGVKTSEGVYSGGPLLAISSKKDDHAIDRAKMLITAGADPNLAAKNGRVPLSYALSLSLADMVALFTQSGADVNVKNKQGRPVAFNFNGNPEKLAILLKHGLDTELTDKEGVTLLMRASLTSVDSVKQILAKGADPDKKPLSGETALMIAKKMQKGLQGKERSTRRLDELKKIEEILLQASKEKKNSA